MEETMRVVKIEGGYAFKRDIQDAYFYPNEMGNFQVKFGYSEKATQFEKNLPLVI